MPTGINKTAVTRTAENKILKLCMECMVGIKKTTLYHYLTTKKNVKLLQKTRKFSRLVFNTWTR